MAYSTYRWCYRILGVSSYCSWDELRLAYRRRLRACHPDLTRAGIDNGVELAGREETFKETIRAFRLLAAYHKQHGALPRPYMPIVVSFSGLHDGANHQQSDRQRRGRKPRKHSVAGKRVLVPRMHQVIVGGFLASVAIVAAANFIAANDGNRDSSFNRSESRDAQLHVGMEPSQVVDLHGVPTLTRGSVWFYGNSGVIFDKGCVIGWENAEPYPLLTQVPIQAHRDEQENRYGNNRNAGWPMNPVCPPEEI